MLGRRVAILGLGRSGFQAALFLRDQGFDVFVSEGSQDEVYQDRLNELKTLGIDGEVGSHSLDAIKSCDWALISPGISPQEDFFKELEPHLDLYSEIEIASRFCNAKKVIAVTGSCGKTTTATLLHKTLIHSGRKSQLCGNIGKTWVESLAEIDSETYVVLEVSSFQLRQCKEFRPDIALILNIHPNHLDWHSDMRDYVDSKLKIFENQQSEDVAIYLRSDREKYFSSKQISAREVALGPEEIRNEEFVSVVCELLEIPKAHLDHVLKDFEGIEHRMEEVPIESSIRVINDSKSTTPAALAWALNQLRDSKVVLIAGGKAKSQGFESCVGLLWKKTRAVIVLGEASEMLMCEWKAVAPVSVLDLESAVELAFRKAEKDDVILFSPGCASFDMFLNYEDRGQKFKSLVRSISKAGASG